MSIRDPVLAADQGRLVSLEILLDSDDVLVVLDLLLLDIFLL